MRSDTCAEPQNSARVSVSDCTSLVAMAGAKASCAPKLFFTMEDDEKLVELVGSHPVLYDLKHPLYKDQRVKDNVWKSIAEAVGRPIADCRRRWKNIKDTNDRRLRETNRTGSEAPSKKRKVWALQDRLSFLQTSEVKRGSFCNVTEEDEESDDPDDLLRESTPQLDTTPDNNTSVSEPNTNDVPREVDRHQPNSVQEVLSGNLNPNPNQPNKSTQPTKKKTNFRENLCMTIEKRSKERDKMIKELLSKEDESDDLDLFFKSICKTVRKFPADLQQRAKLETLTLVSNMELEVWARKTNSENLHIDLPSPSPSNESVSSGSGPSSGSVSHGYSPSPTLLRMIPPHEY